MRNRPGVRKGGGTIKITPEVHIEIYAIDPEKKKKKKTKIQLFHAPVVLRVLGYTDSRLVIHEKH
jgi:hypothetical protein